jgi:spore coat polysaccharide biosynthesis protein SpsF
VEKILVCVQARTGSTRLPGKVLKPLAGKPLLQRMLARVQAASLAAEVIVITTTDAADDPVVELCEEIAVKSFRGHPTDLLDRHYQAAILEKADVVVKIPSDCPLIDPAVIDRVLTHYLDHRGEFDFVSNLHPATYPDGNDVEVMTIETLRAAWSNATLLFEREHTTPYIWERPEQFRLSNVAWEPGLNYSMSHRWTIDYPEDYEFIARVFDELQSGAATPFGLAAILDLLKQKPEIAEMNAKYAGVNWYRNHLGELKTVSSAETRHLQSVS